MENYNHIQIAGPFEQVFKLAADIARWPELLPHYRWVKVLDQHGNRATVEMAARHKGLPVWWKSIQTVSPEDRRIHYTHIGGITRDMEVDWQFEALDPGFRRADVNNRHSGESRNPEQWAIRIHHQFNPKWPFFGPWVAEQIIGKMFVEQIAETTLECIKKIVEGSASPGLRPPSPNGRGVGVRRLNVS